MQAGWIDIYGNFYDLKCYNHNELAKILLATYYGLDSKSAITAATNLCGAGATMTDLLEHYGWIRLHLFYDGHSQWLVIEENKITPSQQAAITEWCIAKKIKYNNAIKIINLNYI